MPPEALCPFDDAMGMPSDLTVITLSGRDSTSGRKSFAARFLDVLLVGRSFVLTGDLRDVGEDVGHLASIYAIYSCEGIV